MQTHVAKDDRHRVQTTLVNAQGQSFEKHSDIVRLKPWQKNRRPFSNPILNNVEEVADEQMAVLIQRHLAGDRKATDELILANLILVKWLVGRYLAHWAVTFSFTDDMCSEGMLAITQHIHSVEEPIEPGDLKAILVVKVKSAIETLINDSRSAISASLRTNYRRVAEGQEPEYHHGESLQALTTETDSVAETRIRGLGRTDDLPIYVDALDALEHLRSIDGEEIVDMVLAAIEQQHHTLEAELTDRERNLIHALASVIGGKAA